MATEPLEYPETPIGVDRMMEDAMALATYRQASVLDTPPVFDAVTMPAFPSYNDALNSMESGLFNDIPVFDSIIQSTNVISSVIDIGQAPAMAGSFAEEPVHAATASTASDVVAPIVQFNYDHPNILMEPKEDGIINSNDPPMPIVRAHSHDHSYIQNESEDYQILRDFLNMGHEIGVVGDCDEEELGAIISTFDFGQLAPRTSYLDTYGDLTCLLNDGAEEGEEQMQDQEMEEASRDQDQSESIQDDGPSTSAQISYPASPEASSVASSQFSQPSTAPKPKGTRKSKKSSGFSSGIKDEKYWERRKKNNVASARSRKTRKERATETELERQQLELINRQLKEEIDQLTRLVNDHKRSFFAVFKK